MKFSKKILETFVDLPKDESRRSGGEGGWQDLMEDVGLEVKSADKTADDVIFNLELLANRGDHYCYLGLATEIIGRNGGQIKKLNPDEDASLPLYDKEPEWGKGEDKKGKYKDIGYLFDLETEKCLAYSLTPFALARPQKKRDTTDKYIARMLPASGVNLILDIIDVTNVVMLERGQPAHIYDADKIKGKIHVRETKAGESAALLFHEGMTPLPAGTCVIADEEKILCVGGIIGCRAAEVDADTKNILFETALFDPVAIRKSERALLEKPTIAAMIFERGGDYSAILSGAKRAKKLYKDVGWEQNGDFQMMAWAHAYEKKFIPVSGDYVRKELEINISDAEIAERLGRYGFAQNDLKTGFYIPACRQWDIKGYAADLLEELARSIGYNALPSHLPPVGIGAAPTAAESRKAETDSYLIHNGFYEVMVDSMYSPKHAALSPNPEHVKIANSVEGGYAFMRNNPIVQAAELTEKNLRVKNRDIRAYEWGKIFKGDNEIEILWGVMNGARESALTAKGLVFNLMNDLGLDAELEYGDFAESAKVSEWSLLHPKRRGRIKCNGRGICVFGEIHPKLLEGFDIKNDAPVFFSFDTAGLLTAARKGAKYASPSAVIQSTRDISVPVPATRAAGDVTDYILKNFSEVADVKITDVYDKPHEGVRNVTYLLTFAERNFSTEELNALLPKIIQSAKGFIAK
ncbi:MAG: phenylalanine--tRNA ligase beta subunit-related protein [Proteobacteria bacterium]|nr:phenylalanine--tRNA ligase beta subunit-related protein [Pseudomonadota bacterium]